VHLVEDGDQGQWNWTSESYPADAVSLRSISSDNVVVVDTTHGADIIGETDFTSALSTLHEKAIYLVEGRLFQVERLDFEGRKAYVRAVDCDYYTDAITYSRVTILDVFASEVVGGADLKVCATDGTGGADARGGQDAGVGQETDVAQRADVAQGFSPATALKSHGDVRVVSRVVGFKKIKFYTNENVGSGELDLPEQQMHTTSYWLTIPRQVMATLPYSLDDRRDGVVGLSFAMRQVAQLLLMCDRHDIGISIGAGDEGPAAGVGLTLQDLDEPRVFVYDSYPGGIGFSEPLFAMHDELVGQTRDLIAGCQCDHGCPTCVGPVGETGPQAKEVALLILDRVTGRRPA
jgi:DEAD/DEAH box helicase domain-containing protein